MTHELVGASTRQAFREYFTGTTLRRIDDAFAVGGIRQKSDFNPPVGGERRTLVEQYYASLNFSRQADIKRLLRVYEHVLDDVEEQLKHGSEESQKSAGRTRDKLLRSLHRDGFEWVNGRLIAKATETHLQEIHDAITSLAGPELTRQLQRLRDAADEDPALAIGTAKEMLETACKTILEEYGTPVPPDWDVPELLKAVRKELKLLPDDIPDGARGAETIKRLLSNLGQIGQGLAELRNLYGSGHGRAGRAKGLSPRHARLAVGAAATLVQFLFETYRERTAL